MAVAIGAAPAGVAIGVATAGVTIGVATAGVNAGISTRSIPLAFIGSVGTVPTYRILLFSSLSNIGILYKGSTSIASTYRSSYIVASLRGLPLTI